MMILEDDHEALARILGTNDIPEPIAIEYGHWIRMYHVAGGSGPMPLPMLICMLRSIGVGPRPLVNEPSTATDWHKVDYGLAVAVAFDGSPEPVRGVFRGIPATGMLAVLLDGEARVRDVEQRRVHLIPSDVTKFLAGLKVETPAAPVATEITSEPIDPADPPSPPVSSPRSNASAFNDELPNRKEVDWKTLKKGAKVWVMVDDLPLDGEFVSLAKSGLIRVSVEGNVGEHKPELVYVNA